MFILLAAGPSLSSLYVVEGYINMEKFMWALVGELVSESRMFAVGVVRPNKNSLCFSLSHVGCGIETMKPRPL